MKNEKTVNPAEGRFADDIASRAWLAAIIEDSADAIITKDLDGNVTSWNRAAEQIFGYTAEEIVGTSIRRLFPSDRMDEEDGILSKIRRGERVGHFLTSRLTKEGAPIDVSITISPIRDAAGNTAGVSSIARDVTDEMRQQKELARMTRLYSALREINQAIVRSSSREELFDMICRVLIEFGGFELAWFGWYDDATRRILPIAVAGKESDYVQEVEVYGDDRPKGRGPIGQAFRAGESSICNDLRENPQMLPWRSQLSKRGIQSSASFPIRQKGAPRGTLSVYSKDPWFFREKEVALLEEAAGDVSFALDNFADRSARRAMEKVAVDERQFSDTAIESMPGVIYFMDEKGRYLRWNKNFERVTGYSGDEIRRMHPVDFFAADAREMISERIATALEGGESFAEASLVSKNGRETPYFFTGRRIAFNELPCVVGVGIDISERKAAERELNETKRQLESIIEDLREGLVIADDEREEVRWNPAALQMLGFSDLEEARRQQQRFDTMFELYTLDGEPVPSGSRPLDRVRRGEPIDGIELRVRRTDTAWERTFSYTGSLEEYAGGRRIAFMTLRDVTEERRAQFELRSLNQKLELEVANRTADLKSALVRAEAADRVKSAFLATMSHELRTPLNTIIGFTGVLFRGMSGSLNGEQSKQLGMVQKSARHLLDLINDVLDISKIEAEQVEVRHEPFELTASIQNVLESVRAAANEKNLSIEVMAAPDLGEIVSDRRRVEQILLNLLSNAVKFTDEGAITLHAERHDASPSRSSAPSRPIVRISVEDSGIGIRPEDIASLFQAFKQLDTGTQRKHEGTGLGLAISRRLAELLGGELSVTSEWRHGSTFTLILPCDKVGVP